MKNFKEILKDRVCAHIKEHEFFDMYDLLGMGGIISEIKEWPTDSEDNEIFSTSIFSEIEVTSITDDDMEICFTFANDKETSYLAGIEYSEEDNSFICSYFDEGYVSGMLKEDFLEELFQTSNIVKIIENN